jgi:hypothetical protein
MPLYRMLAEAAFDPDAVKGFTTAYEDVLVALGLERRTDPLTLMIAAKIIKHAQRGERLAPADRPPGAGAAERQ